MPTCTHSFVTAFTYLPLFSTPAHALFCLRLLADGMEQESHLLNIPSELWMEAIAPLLLGAELGRLRGVSKGFLKLLSDEDLWMDKLTVLVLAHPVLSDLDKGVDESCYMWYARCERAISDGSAMARQHKAGAHPYLSTLGTIDGSVFIPYTSPLRFPVARGFIAELITFMRAHPGVYYDAPKDAATLFTESPGSVDAAFRRISLAVDELTRRACPPSNPTKQLDKLAELLSAVYVPASQRSYVAADGVVQAAPPSSRRALDTLQRRLGRATLALASADKRVAELEAENLRLHGVIKEMGCVIEAQAATIVTLKSKCRSLQGALEEAKREVKGLEKRPTAEELQAVSEKLASERKAKRAVDRVLAQMVKEQTRLRRLLTNANKGFDEATAAMERAEAAVAATTSAAALKCLQAARAERDAAAQVALAQLEAAEWMDAALDEKVAAEVEARGLMTEEELLASVRKQAQAGEFTDAVRSMTGIVMAQECAGSSSSTSFRPDNVSGKGRAAHYKKLVRTIKASNLLSSTQLHLRSKLLAKEIERVGGGEKAAKVAQVAHLINANLELFESALRESKLAPATPMSLDQWAEIGTQVSSCLGEQIRTFFRKSCGNKFPTKAQIKAHYSHSHFDFHTFPYEAVDVVETKVVNSDGTEHIKLTKKYTRGVCGSIKSLEDVLVRVLQQHQKAGNISYPGNIPAGFVPFQICLDAGAGTTKVILKLNIVKNSDAIKNLVLLAILSKAKDTYSAMAVAFKSIFDDFNRINEEGFWLKVGWRPALPLDHSIELFGAELEPRLREK